MKTAFLPSSAFSPHSSVFLRHLLPLLLYFSLHSSPSNLSFSSCDQMLSGSLTTCGWHQLPTHWDQRSWCMKRKPRWDTASVCVCVCACWILLTSPNSYFLHFSLSKKMQDAEDTDLMVFTSAVLRQDQLHACGFHKSQLHYFFDLFSFSLCFLGTTSCLAL